MGGLSGIGSVSARRIGAPQLREPAQPPAPDLMRSVDEPLVRRLRQFQLHALEAPHGYPPRKEWVRVEVFGESLDLPITQDHRGRDCVHSSALALERIGKDDYRLRGLAQHSVPFPDLTVTVRDERGCASTILLDTPQGDPVDAGSGQALGDSQRGCIAALLGQALQQEISCQPDPDRPGLVLLRYEVEQGDAWDDPPHVSVLLTVDPAEPGCWSLLECMVFAVDRRRESHPLVVVSFPQGRLDSAKRDAEPVSQPEAAATEPASQTSEPIEPPHKRARLVAGPQAHSDMLNWPSDSWRAILAVITGDSETLHQSG